MPQNRIELVYPVLLVVALLGGWQLWVSVGHVQPFEFPKLTAVLNVLIHSSILRSAAVVTIRLMVVGLLMAVGLALTIAFLTLLVRPFEVGVFPMVLASQFVPLIALTPLFVIWFGFGDLPRLIMVMLFGFFPVLITVLTGLRSLEFEKLYLARSTGANSITTLIKIRLPAALPNFFIGLKITVLSCLIGSVVAEFFIGDNGLGTIIVKASAEDDAAGVIASVVYLALIGEAGFVLVTIAERLLVPWSPSRRSSQVGLM